MLDFFSHTLIIVMVGLLSGCGSGNSSAPASGSAPPLLPTAKVLFIGNSYTYVNNLPDLVYQFALADNVAMSYDSSATGGASFATHRYSSVTQAAISAQAWDFVVLQDQSQTPSQTPADVFAYALPNAQALVDAIKLNDAASQIIYFETWGRENGDVDNCLYYSLVCTFAGHTQALDDGYNIYLTNTGGKIAPVGLAWKAVVDDTAAPFTQTAMWSNDGSHPGLTGSYLTAAVIYASIFNISPVGNSYTAGLNASIAVYLQQQAATLVGL